MGNMKDFDPGRDPIGQSLRRREDQRFLTGAGNYTDDVTQHRQTFACFLRRASSPSSPAPTWPAARSAGCPAAG